MTDLNPHHVELDSGHQKVAGVIGGRVFWIDLVDADGSRLSLWLGHNYDEGIEVSEKIRLAWEITEPVRDLVVGDFA